MLSYEFIIKEYNIFNNIRLVNVCISTLCNDSLNYSFSSDKIANDVLRNWMMDFMGISSLSFNSMRRKYYLKIKKRESIDKDWLLNEWKIVYEETYNSDLKNHLLRIPFYLLMSRLRLYQILIIYGTFILLWVQLTLISHGSPVIRKEINTF